LNKFWTPRRIGVASALPLFLWLGALFACKPPDREPQAGITVYATADPITTEYGQTVSVVVVLDTRPLADVHLELASSDPTEGAVSPAGLTFTPSDWSIAQFVAASGVDDELADGSQDWVLLTDAAVSDDPEYDGLDAPDLTIENLDDDSPGFLVDPASGLRTTEAGACDSFTIMLNKPPVAEVTMMLSSSDSSEGTVIPTSLTFTPADWDQPRMVTVTGVQDSRADGLRAYRVVMPPVTSADADFNGLDPQDVTALNADDDSRAAAGYQHTLALKSDGTLWAWGWNNYGQLGDGTTVNKSTPVAIGADTQWLVVSGGVYHCAAVKLDGTLWTWGRNSSGQLGDGGNTDRWTPAAIDSLHSWGFVAAGGSHTVALKTDGTLWAWGSNTYGQVGDGSGSTRYYPRQIGFDNHWVSVAAGIFHTVAVKSDGTLWAWGLNSRGQLGDGTTTDRYSPGMIGTDTDWVAVEAGQWHTAAVKSNGTLWAWGDNEYGQLGDGTIVGKSSPTRVGTGADWTAVAAGDWHTLARKTDGTLWAFGYNYYGQLGDDTSVNKDVPTQIGVAQTWIQVAGGGDHSLAISLGSGLWSWGENWRGQVGDGTTTHRDLPVQLW
jgi:alpha-tubulin suppressor-like RCC1 family protein